MKREWFVNISFHDGKSYNGYVVDVLKPKDDSLFSREELIKILQDQTTNICRLFGTGNHPPDRSQIASVGSKIIVTRPEGVATISPVESE